MYLHFNIWLRGATVRLNFLSFSTSDVTTMTSQDDYPHDARPHQQMMADITCRIGVIIVCDDHQKSILFFLPIIFIVITMSVTVTIAMKKLIGDLMVALMVVVPVLV